jgi:hypothetical protein
MISEQPELEIKESDLSSKEQAHSPRNTLTTHSHAIPYHCSSVSLLPVFAQFVLPLIILAGKKIKYIASSLVQVLLFGERAAFANAESLRFVSA